MPQNGGTPAERPPAASLVVPIILIIVGALYLYANWQPAFRPWSIIRTYWPLILIFVGLGKVWDATRPRTSSGQRQFPVGSTLAVVIFALVVVGLVASGKGRVRGDRTWATGSDRSSETVELQGAKSVKTQINMDAGQLNIAGGANRLLESDFTFTGQWEKPRVSYSVDNGVGDLQISQEGSGPSIGHHDNTWHLNFSDAAPMELRINMGAGQGNLKLRGVDVTRLEVHLGAGEFNIDLTGPRKSDLSADVQGGVGHAQIRLPKDVGVIATARGAIGSVRVRGLTKHDDEYTNEAYGKSPRTIRLNVQGGIGEIDLEQE